MNDERVVGQLLLLFSGFLIWGLHFTVVYAVTSYGCARGGADGLTPSELILPGVAMATALAAAAVALVAILSWRRRSVPAPDGPASEAAPFIRRMTAGVAALALVAILWNGLPALVMPPCLP